MFFTKFAFVNDGAEKANVSISETNHQDIPIRRAELHTRRGI